MNKLIPLFAFVLSSVFAFAQCDDLFISEYVEGYSNNKALEIYNPTSSAVNLSDYALARFSNGSTVAGSNKVIQLPDAMLEAGDVFVVVVDLTDTADWDSQFDKPAWNGYNVVDTIFDVVTGEAVTDTFGNVLIGPQYSDSGAAIFGSDYNEEYDLQCKADAFLCPDYDTNNTMYFNGNDAVVLLTGTEIAADGSNILDVIGVIGEDPTVTLEEDAWVDADGRWLTKDRTLVRKSEVVSGRNALDQIIASAGGSFMGEEWNVQSKNDFSYLGIHNSSCNSESLPNQFSCSRGPLSTYEINNVGLSIFPNPNNTELLYIEAEENIQSVELLNIMGQNLRTESNTSGSNATLALTDIQKGIYIVKVHFTQNNFSTQKLIIE